jgi:hypothetical protein
MESCNILALLAVLHGIGWRTVKTEDKSRITRAEKLLDECEIDADGP